MGGIPAWAVPGAKCVCICEYWDLVTGHTDLNIAPKKGDLCVISSTGWFPSGEAAVGLVGYPAENGYRISGFRPAVEDSDELGIETVLYRQKGRKSKAPARESEPVQ